MLCSEELSAMIKMQHSQSWGASTHADLGKGLFWKELNSCSSSPGSFCGAREETVIFGVSLF